LTGYHSIIFP
jgi:hypothetical protein